MALIKCNDCGHDISEKAAACINCGSPTTLAIKATRQSAGKVITIQGTSKKFKLQALLSLIVFGLGVGFMLADLNESRGQQPSGIPIMFIFVGLAWYLINRFRIWWNHE